MATLQWALSPRSASPNRRRARICARNFELGVFPCPWVGKELRVLPLGIRESAFPYNRRLSRRSYPKDGGASPPPPPEYYKVAMGSAPPQNTIRVARAPPHPPIAPNAGKAPAPSAPSGALYRGIWTAEGRLRHRFHLLPTTFSLLAPTMGTLVVRLVVKGWGIILAPVFHRGGARASPPVFFLRRPPLSIVLKIWIPCCLLR